MSARVAVMIVTLVASASCSSQSFEPGRDILLYDGDGTSRNDVAAIEAILTKNKLSYSKIDFRQLSSLDETQLLRSKLLIVPGGDYIEMAEGLSDESVAKVRNAVDRGLNYLGICAGAILAGYTAGKCFDLTSGVKFDFYDDVNRNVHKNVVTITSAEGETCEQYWEDGPQLNGWGSVVSKYPDGTAATVQGDYGQGRVILCGFHPEAPESWRRGLSFKTSAAASNAYALMLIEAALNRRELPHY
jgi:glutamine amidotransferase-like uncharacterized protein